MQGEFDFPFSDTPEVLFNMLCHGRSATYKDKNRKVSRFLVLNKGDIKHYIYLPDNVEPTDGFINYVQMKRFIIVKDEGMVFVCIDKPVSMLSLMFYRETSLYEACAFYNSVSEGVGDYKLFGKIEEIIDCKSGAVIHAFE